MGNCTVIYPHFGHAVWSHILRLAFWLRSLVTHFASRILVAQFGHALWLLYGETVRINISIEKSTNFHKIPQNFLGKCKFCSAQGKMLSNIVVDAGNRIIRKLALQRIHALIKMAH